MFIVLLLTCVFIICYLYVQLGFIESVSDTKFKKSQEVFSWHNIAIFSDKNWPSWLPILVLWFQSASNDPSGPILTMFAKGRQLFNLFGLNRSSNIKWLTQNLTSASNQQLMDILLRMDACFYDGDFALFNVIYRIWLSLPSGLRPHLICTLPNRCRLQTIGQCEEIVWKRASHDAVGGITTSQVWIGFSMPTLPMPHSHPQPCYCRHVIQDLLEFAPRNVDVLPIERSMVPESFTTRVQIPVPYAALPNTFGSQGLLPLARVSQTLLPRLLCPTPFTPSRVCIRKFTTKELARFVDLPVAYETCLTRVCGSIASVNSPLLHSIPLKLLQHALYLSGVIEICATASENASPRDNNADGGG